MEVPRYMFALKGVEYVDGRYTTEAPYDNVKSISDIKDTLDANMGRMPVLTVDDKIHIGQSAAINLYVAQELDMMGDSNEEAASIISISEHLKELKDSAPWGYFDTPTEEQLVEFFESGPTGASGPADMKLRSKRRLGFYLARLESLVGSDGFAVGTRFSLADALIYFMFGETLKDDEAKETVAQHKREPLCSAARTEKALATAPKIKKIVDTFRAHAGVAKWLSTRGIQRF